MANLNRTLNLLMNGILVGTLTKHNTGMLSFRYTPSWLKTPGARPLSLSLPLIDQEYHGDVVHNFFDNLLPDNPEIRSRIQAKFHISTNQAFDLLAHIGQDCVGAIQMAEGTPLFHKQIDAEHVTKKTIARVLKNFKTAPLGMVSSEQDFRISIAGAQEKSAFLYYQKAWYRPSGATPTTHIFKLPIGFIEHQHIDLRDSCENEWLCTEIAKAFGLPVAQASIQQFDDVKTLVVERFDRQWSGDKKWLLRLPQEDLCQALGYSSHLKYESDGGPGILEIMQLLLGSQQATSDRELFFRTQIIFFLLAAIDGHAKNFSIFIKPLGAYCLTPLYDIMSAYPLLATRQLEKQKIKMAMALIGKNKHYHWHTIRRRHFISTALAAQFSTEKVETMLEELLSKVEPVIATVSAKLPRHFPQPIADAIFNGLRQAKELLVLSL